jgi:dihydrofolate synthase/folylpolyglutamate synthase
LQILKPIIKRVEIMPILNERVEQIELLEDVLRSLDIGFSRFKDIDKDEKYLVFGSFSVIEEFFKYYDGDKRK